MQAYFAVLVAKQYCRCQFVWAGYYAVVIDE